jgi:hypothetical protein
VARWLAPVVFVLLSSVPFPRPARATVWNVRSDGSSPLTLIQDAVNLAADGDTVDVGPGFYNERVSIVDKTLLVRGAGRDLTEVNGYPHGNVFALRGYGNYTEIRALTIKDGWADRPIDVNGGIYGGGVLGDGAVFALVDCRITHCYAMSLGGAVYATSLRIIPDELRGSSRPGRAPVRPGSDHQVITLRDCEFDGNTAGAEGGAFNFEFAYFVVENCVVRDNFAADGGGGRVFNSYGRVSGCLFRNNAAEFDGGALDTEQNTYFEDTSILIEANTIVENRARRDGAGAYITRGITISYERNLFALNGGEATTVINCRLPEGEYKGGCNHFWNNSAASLGECTPLPSDTSGDPLFCGAATGDFRVCEGSPVLAGPCGPRGALGAGCSGAGCSTPILPVTWSGVKTLYH